MVGPMAKFILGRSYLGGCFIHKEGIPQLPNLRTSLILRRENCQDFCLLLKCSEVQKEPVQNSEGKKELRAKSAKKVSFS